MTLIRPTRCHPIPLGICHLLHAQPAQVNTVAKSPIHIVTNTTVAQPEPATMPVDRFATEPEYQVNITTAGEIVQGKPRHRILFEESPELTDGWGEIPSDFSSIQTSMSHVRSRSRQADPEGHRTGPALIGSMGNGSTTHLDLMTCELKRPNADHPKNVKWELTRPDTWLLEADKGPPIINDSYDRLSVGITLLNRSPPASSGSRLGASCSRMQRKQSLCWRLQ